MSKNIVSLLSSKTTRLFHSAFSNFSRKHFSRSCKTGETILRTFINHKNNPIITYADISDCGSVDFVADPFLIHDDDKYYIFFEVFNSDSEPTAKIGYATAEGDYFDWTYNGIILEEETHLSYPYVINYDGQYYMIPDKQSSAKDAAISLYGSESFPDEWHKICELYKPDYRPGDSTIINWKNTWWMFVGDLSNNQLRAYYSSCLRSKNWTPHPENPIKVDNYTRPGGQPIIRQKNLILFLQDCEEQYGNKLYVCEINKLNKNTISYTISDESLIEGRGKFGWNSGRMHHISHIEIDENKWLCAIDGDIDFGRGVWTGSSWSIGICNLEISI